MQLNLTMHKELVRMAMLHNLLRAGLSSLVMQWALCE